MAELNLGQNYIMDIAEGLFIQNAKMEKLILYSNSLIEMREKSLMGLDNLLSLLINNNLLENIHHDCFLYAPNIQKLWVLVDKVERLEIFHEISNFYWTNEKHFEKSESDWKKMALHNLSFQFCIFTLHLKYSCFRWINLVSLQALGQ